MLCSRSGLQVQVEELCARLWPYQLLVMQELFPVRNRRAELGEDVQPVIGMTEKWESELGSDLQTIGRVCESTGLPEMLLSLAEQHPRMSISKNRFCK